jgi:hypothetical protein
MRTAQIFYIVALVVVGCSDGKEQAGSPDSADRSRVESKAAAPRPVASAPGSKGVLISKSEYGEDWPYTVESGRLYCDPPGSNVVMEAGGRVYALNGRAMGNATQRGYLNARETITLRDEYGYFTIGDSQKIISRGLSMCR